MEQVTKACHKCRIEKPFSEFSKNRARPDGYQHWCKKCRFEQQKISYANNPEYRAKKQAQARKWKKSVNYKSKYEGAEIGRIRAKNYRDTHPGYNAAQHAKRNARKKGGGGSFTATEFKNLCNECGNRCLCCGRSDVRLDRDHILAVERGGSSNIKNIQPLCCTCNVRKGIKYIDYRAPFVALAT